LFENAEIIDKNLPKELNEVNIKSEDVKQIERCMNIIKQRISLYYTNKLNRDDLCEATKIRLAKEFEADKETYNKLKKNVTTAIKFFNEKNYLERRKDFWPTLFGEEIKVD
jgi:hypothetical protein